MEDSEKESLGNGKINDKAVVNVSNVIDENDLESLQIDEDFMNNTEWKEKDKHIFILSSAGKPVYSRYGSEDRLVTLFGVMQALVSFVQDSDDVIQSIHAGDCVIVFLIKGPIILVAVSQIYESVDQLSLQLRYVYNQIVSILTLKQLTKIFEERRNFDLRRLLTGSERLIDHILNFTETEPMYLLSAIKCLPLSSTFREAIGQTIVSACAKIKNLVYAILIADNQLITMVRMKKYNLQASDLHLIFNLVSASESFKAAESWTPICLPNFDSSGFLHAHVSYLAEDCQACLLLLTVDHDLFFTLSEAKQRIVERLRRNNSLEAINAALAEPPTTVAELGVTGLRHCLYKCRTSQQLWSPAVEAPYHTEEQAVRLRRVYQQLHGCVHRHNGALKLAYQQLPLETMLGWITAGFELYVAFEPLMTKRNTINAVNKILQWIHKKESRLFIPTMPTF
ncbi:vacuolar fusion protein MON1 homolog A isoform X1 [Homalodisca vitripennis]|uniref:vacuolar fusion protein MON1 homolog A isoform X1 n=1 Tax=Homalodisca vitripennis TaxID=197043 RepID=UPI001EEC4CA4|nr:vacuolar fusion protein MON1 homolog A isoform X1 [Homalodisca vitripennis]